LQEQLKHARSSAKISMLGPNESMIHLQGSVAVGNGFGCLPQCPGGLLLAFCGDHLSKKKDLEDFGFGAIFTVL
jgi:hypothetical protein